MKQSSRQNHLLTKNNGYSTNEFIEDLNRVLSNILPLPIVVDSQKISLNNKGTLPDTNLSYLLCRYNKKIKRIKRNIREGNFSYKIAKDELKEWEHNLNSILGDRVSIILPSFQKYEKNNKNLPNSRKNGKKVLNFHPNLKIDYFENINTRSKAYWLGFLWAEVYIGKNYEITLDLSKKDEFQIDKFIKELGLNPNYKCSWNRRKKSGLKLYVRIRFKCSKMVKDLKKLGYIASRYKKSRFPILNNHELDLAFLLGFFDGDGKAGTNQFHIGSKFILEDIKDKFQIKHQIIPDGVGYYYLSVGAKIFNDMLNNYSDSLPRKRKYFRVPSRTIFKDTITKKGLSKLIWEMPIKKISEKFNTYPRIVRETCEEWKIERPNPDYWHKSNRK